MCYIKIIFKNKKIYYFNIFPGEKYFKKHSFKPGLVQGPGSGFWSGRWVGRVNPYFKKNSKRCRFSKKTKVNGLQPGFVGSTGSAGSHRVMIFSIFHQLRPVPAPGRPDPGSTRQARQNFKTMLRIIITILLNTLF